MQVESKSSSCSRGSAHEKPSVNSAETWNSVLKDEGTSCWMQQSLDFGIWKGPLEFRQFNNILMSGGNFIFFSFSQLILGFYNYCSIVTWFGWPWWRVLSRVSFVNVMQKSQILSPLLYLRNAITSKRLVACICIIKHHHTPQWTIESHETEPSICQLPP